MTDPVQLNVTSARDIRVANLSLTADVVIIGSGAGGAVMAYEMAKAGKNVVVLEAGPFVPSSQFNEQFPDMLERLYADCGNQATSSGDLLVLQGACIGGSTVVNGCVAFRTPEFILADWQQQSGLTNLTGEVLKPYFEKIEKNLSIHENQEHEINLNSRMLQQGARTLGWSVKPLQRNVRQCGLTGHCLSGCKTDRKQSMLVTYLPWASHHGAKIHADTRVTRIHVQDGSATGVSAEIIDPATKRKVADMQVSAKIVVAAAGAVQTPLLFLRSGIGNSSGQVGKHFACHPSTLVVAEFDQDIHTWRGAMLGIFVDEFMHPDKGGFVLEGGGAGPVEIGMSTEPGTGTPYMDFMSRAQKYASCVTLIHDQNNGQIKLEDGRKVIDYALSDHDFPAMKAAIKAAAQAYFAAGAKRVFLPTIQRKIAGSADQLDPLLDSLANDPFTFRMVSFHPQGGMRMGADASQSVVNPWGETHDVKRLFVADASLFPTSISVNPQVTVYALSNYIADYILKEKTAYFA